MEVNTISKRIILPEQENNTYCQPVASGLISTRRLYLRQIVNKYVTGKCVEE